MSEKKPPHCIEGGCRLPVAEKSAAWCERHEIERQERITRQLEGIKARLDEMRVAAEEMEASTLESEP